MDLNSLMNDVADELVAIDSSRIPFKHFQPGVGPYGEPQLIKELAQRLSKKPGYGKAISKRTPDLLIEDAWAIEFKIVRPFGDNGKLAENWSINLLHPYQGNVSLIGDCLKLTELPLKEKRAVAAISYEHSTPQVDIHRLVRSFEILSREIAEIQLGNRIEILRRGLIHPVHQQLRVFAWELL